MAGGPYGSIVVGGWKGGAYTHDRTGKFTHCAAGASYRSGIYFMVVMTATGGWRLGFSHQDWRLSQGEAFPIDLMFDGQARFHVVGTALATDLVLVPMPSNSSLMVRFRKSEGMTAVAKGHVFEFKLDGTSRLMPTLANCVASVKARGIRNAGDFTIRQAAKPAPPPATGGSLRAEPQQTASTELQLEATVLASNFIIRSTLNGARLLNRSETPVELASTGAAWRSDEAAGFVRIIPTDANIKGIDVTASIIAADAKDCKGKFASGRKSELIDSEVVFHGFASCEDSNGARFAQYFVVPRTKGGFVMFSVVSDMKSERARSVTQSDRSGSFQKAALVAVKQ
jgi:hypothetical protein